MYEHVPKSPTTWFQENGRVKNGWMAEDAPLKGKIRVLVLHIQGEDLKISVRNNE